MPKKYKVRLFKQTGYNLTDVPGSKTVLNKNTYEDTEVIMEWQSRVLTHIQVEPTTSFLIEDCDYAMITEVNGKDGDMLYYVGKGIRYLEEGTVVLPLVFDAVGTALVNNVLKNSIVGGRVGRRHTNEENVIPEPFTPTRPRVRKHIEIDFISIGPPGYEYTSYIPLVIASTDLSDLASQGEGLPAGQFLTENGEGVIVPALPSPNESTEFYIATRYDAHINPLLFYAKRPLPQKILYWGDVYTTNEPPYVNNGKNIAQMLRGLGLDSIIGSAYSFPTVFYDESKSEPASGNNVLGFKKFTTKPVIKKFPFPIMGPETANGVKLQNKKTRFLHRRFTVQSVASLSSQMYEAWELMLDVNKDNPEDNSLVALADPSPQGTMFVRPKFVKYSNSSGVVPEGNYIDGFYKSVPSLPWNAYTLAAEGGEIVLATADYANQLGLILSEREMIRANQDVNRRQYANGLIAGAMQHNVGYHTFNTIGTALGATKGSGVHWQPGQMQATIPGSGWANMGVSRTQAPGSAVTTINGMAIAGAAAEVVKNSIDAGIAAAQFDNLYKSGALEAQMLAQHAYERTSLTTREQSMNLALMQSYMQPPTFLSEAPVGLTSAFIGRYQITMEDIDDEDKLLEDLLFSMEGYQVNEAYMGSQDYDKCFYSRAKYNYVQFDQCHVNTPYNGDISAEVSSRLIAGVRVWHDKVSLGAYYQPNPKR